VIVCVAANPSIDKLFVVEELRPGCVHRPLEFVQVPGGKALNVARAVAAVGGDPLIVALVGGHTGRWIVEGLEAERLPGRYAWTDHETRASLSVADRQTASLTEFYEAGAEIDRAAWTAFVSEVGPALEGSSWVVVSGSPPLAAPREGYAEIIRLAAARGVATALDASRDLLAGGLEAGPSLVKINAAEASELLGDDVESVRDAVRAVRRLRERAGGEGRAAVVTRGVDGAVLITPDGATWQARLAVRGPYPVGSGDAFLGGMLVGLERGVPWPRALALAMATAVSNAEQAGAGRLRDGRVGELVERTEIERIG
jgi:1-phosphofructokinase family hexose kinase